MADVVREIVLHADDVAAAGFDGRDEIEDPLEEALSASDLGEVTGGGGGTGYMNIDLEVGGGRFAAALRLVRHALRDLKVPPTTRIIRREPPQAEYGVYD